MHLAYLLPCSFNFWFPLNILCKYQMILSKHVLWTEAEFSACLACNWPDRHWQWWVAKTSSHTFAAKRRTLWTTIVIIFSHMTDISVFVKCDTIFWLLFFWKLPQIQTSKFLQIYLNISSNSVNLVPIVFTLSSFE